MLQTFDIYLASAGTGKTSCLMNILIDELSNGVPPEKIAFVTYTRAGAQVARERASKKLGIPQSRLTNFRTIHSLCFRGTGAVKEQMMDAPKYKVFGEQAGYNLDHMDNCGMEGLNWDEIRDRDLLALEQLYRNNKPYFDRVSEDRLDNLQFVRFIESYQKFRQAYDYRDFTDLLEQYIRDDLIEDVEVALLDEMQDSSPLQWQVVFKAFKNAKRIYVAGDSKQCIYRYSGADSSIMEKLRGRQHVLDISYRVPAPILKMANEIAGMMSDILQIPCKSASEEGRIEYIRGFDDIPPIDMNRTYYFLARTRSLLKGFEDWCKEHAYNYYKNGNPYISKQDLFEYKNGDMEDKKKRLFIHDMIADGHETDSPNIIISTIHGVKGGEADVVVLRSDISTLVNKSMEVDEDAEHRVFYVGVTRAIHELYVMEPQTRLSYPYIL